MIFDWVKSNGGGEAICSTKKSCVIKVCCIEEMIMWRLCVGAPVVDKTMLVLNLGVLILVNSKLLVNVTVAAWKFLQYIYNRQFNIFLLCAFIYNVFVLNARCWIYHEMLFMCFLNLTNSILINMWKKLSRAMFLGTLFFVTFGEVQRISLILCLNCVYWLCRGWHFLTTHSSWIIYIFN